MGEWHNETDEERACRERIEEAEVREYRRRNPRSSQATHPVIPSRHKPLADPQQFMAGTESVTSDGRIIMNLIRVSPTRQEFTMPVVPESKGGHPGVQIGCTWVSALLIEQIYFMMSPPRIREFTSAELAIIQEELAKPQKITVTYADEAEVVTSLPRHPRPRARKKESPTS